jgi:tripartite ATP-independent transporter DctM subunit
MDVLILLGSFTLLCALGVPVAYALGLAALLAAVWMDFPTFGLLAAKLAENDYQGAMNAVDSPLAIAVIQKIADGTDDFALLAIPFFVLAGAIMAEGGMAARLVNLAKVFFGVIRGGLALVNILASTFFGCISGSSVADTASIGSVMIPQMVKQGYSRVFATNVTICGSVQALMIPPSHNAVIYSVAAGGTISVAHLFLAGIFPGLLFGLSLVGLILWTAHRRQLPKSDPLPLKAIPRILWEAVPGLITVGIIMGGILSGVFTPTESAAVACVYAFLVTFLFYNDYKWRDLPHLIHRVVKTVAMVMLLIGFSVCFGYMMVIMQVPAKVTALFLSISENKYVFLLLVNILLLVLGTFMDLAPMLLICTPIFLPVIAKLGIDPVHFGMIMILNLGIGLITPPVGPTLFVGCAIGKVTMEEVSKELWPFYGAMCIALLLVTYIPAISLWLPGLTK